jgi:nucleotide-binding universal stress UspA family protein
MSEQPWGREILVALDGSEKGERALSTALALSELSEAGVHLVHVVPPAAEPPSIYAAFGGGDIAPGIASSRLDVETQLAEAARDLTTRSRRPISWEVIEDLDVPGALLRVAEARNVGTVVMGTRAATSVGRAIAGSVADRVMRDCPKPVLLVPPGADYLSGKHIEIKRVLVPLDGSELADRSVEFLLALPHARDLEFVILGIVQNPHDAEVVERRLDVAADRFRGRSADATARVAFGDDAAAAIVLATREFLVEMIAMSTRGEGGLRRLILGSVAEGVVRASEVPVLLLTPRMLAATPRDESSRLVGTEPI